MYPLAEKKRVELRNQQALTGKLFPGALLEEVGFLTDVAQETAEATKSLSEVILVKEVKGFTVQRPLNVLDKLQEMIFSPQEGKCVGLE